MILTTQEETITDQYLQKALILATEYGAMPKEITASHWDNAHHITIEDRSFNTVAILYSCIRLIKIKLESELPSSHQELINLLDLALNNQFLQLISEIEKLPNYVEGYLIKKKPHWNATQKENQDNILLYLLLQSLQKIADYWVVRNLLRKKKSILLNATDQAIAKLNQHFNSKLAGESIDPIPSTANLIKIPNQKQKHGDTFFKIKNPSYYHNKNTLILTGTLLVIIALLLQNEMSCGLFFDITTLPKKNLTDYTVQANLTG